MTSVSLTGTGIIILTIEQGLKLWGIEVPEGTAAAAINGLVVFFGFVLLVIGQIRRDDLHFGFIRKN